MLPSMMMMMMMMIIIIIMMMMMMMRRRRRRRATLTSILHAKHPPFLFSTIMYYSTKPQCSIGARHGKPVWWFEKHLFIFQCF